MKISLALTVIISHSLLIALVGLLPLFRSAAIALLTIEAIGIILFCQHTGHSPLSLACLLGLAIALVIGV